MPAYTLDNYYLNLAPVIIYVNTELVCLVSTEYGKHHTYILGYGKPIYRPEYVFEETSIILLCGIFQDKFCNFVPNDFHDFTRRDLEYLANFNTLREVIS